MHIADHSKFFQPFFPFFFLSFSPFLPLSFFSFLFLFPSFLQLILFKILHPFLSFSFSFASGSCYQPFFLSLYVTVPRTTSQMFPSLPLRSLSFERERKSKERKRERMRERERKREGGRESEIEKERAKESENRPHQRWHACSKAFSPPSRNSVAVIEVAEEKAISVCFLQESYCLARFQRASERAKKAAAFVR